MSNVLFYLFFASSLFFASLGFSQTPDYQDVISHLHEKNDSSIAEYKEKGAYFHLERLLFLPEGIFVQSDEGNLLSLPHIFIKDGRYYLARQSGYTCNTCGARYPVHKPSKCYVCGGTSFSPYWDCDQ